MGKTIISDDGLYEWDELKDKQNAKKHGFHFCEILDVFSDKAFFTGFDYKHSGDEERHFGLGSIFDLFVVVFFTIREERTRLISARQADKRDMEVYLDYFKKTNS